MSRNYPIRPRYPELNSDDFDQEPGRIARALSVSVVRKPWVLCHNQETEHLAAHKCWWRLLGGSASQLPRGVWDSGRGTTWCEEKVAELGDLVVLSHRPQLPPTQRCLPRTPYHSFCVMPSCGHHSIEPLRVSRAGMPLYSPSGLSQHGPASLGSVARCQHRRKDVHHLFLRLRDLEVLLAGDFGVLGMLKVECGPSQGYIVA
ncbi:hypothetical protein DFH07DRAFT_769614 [Mycena maculata]|uniref:Uncharacterized protein n=1 Tax=Mycena maculata TaxID=230809 RepID=A0AAD7JP43_9AGAR|nr:hypothetical protein DFH07DRAFT_769614 [Mycena maculata]